MPCPVLRDPNILLFFWGGDDKQAKSRSYLVKHQRALHEGIKYPCRQCGKEFTMKGEVRQHQLAVHDKVKYQCNQCNHQTTCKKYLAEHKRTVHTGVKYHCKQCNHQVKTKVVLFNTKGQFMKGSNSLVGIATYKHLQRGIL